MSSSSSEVVDSNNDASLGEEEQDVSVSITTQAMNYNSKVLYNLFLRVTCRFLY